LMQVKMTLQMPADGPVNGHQGLRPKAAKERTRGE
jgi:hypothetical protein